MTPTAEVGDRRLQQAATGWTQEAIMSLRFVGSDPESGDGNCPAVWVDLESDSGPEVLVQGWLPDDATLEQCSADTPRPPSEGVVRIPARMVPLLRKACDEAERAGLR
ncbi:hypothetical protein ACWF95_37065 [Streptomyces vinaceus]